MAFLGHEISKDGIQVNPKKIEAILEWPKPTTVIEVKKPVRLDKKNKRCEVRNWKFNFKF